MSTTPDALDVSWIVPLYRNGVFASELMSRVCQVRTELGIGTEIVFVDDACPEQSGRTAMDSAPSFPAARVHLVALSVNRGQDSAIREGLRICRGSHAMIIDGDLQDPPEMLGPLWRVMQDGHCDVVFAARHGAYESSGRLASSQCYRHAMEWIGGLPPRSGVCALLNRVAIEVVAATKVRRISILAALAGARLRYGSVAVKRNSRREGQSAYSNWRRMERALHSIGQTVQARWFRIPL